MDDLNFIVLQSTKELGRLSTIVPEFFFVFCSSFFRYLIFLAEIKIPAVYHYLVDSKFTLKICLLLSLCTWMIIWGSMVTNCQM